MTPAPMSSTIPARMKSIDPTLVLYDGNNVNRTNGETEPYEVELSGTIRAIIMVDNDSRLDSCLLIPHGGSGYAGSFTDSGGSGSGTHNVEVSWNSSALATDCWLILRASASDIVTGQPSGDEEWYVHLVEDYDLGSCDLVDNPDGPGGGGDGMVAAMAHQLDEPLDIRIVSNLPGRVPASFYVVVNLPLNVQLTEVKGVPYLTTGTVPTLDTPTVRGTVLTTGSRLRICRLPLVAGKKYALKFIAPGYATYQTPVTNTTLYEAAT